VPESRFSIAARSIKLGDFILSPEKADSARPFIPAQGFSHVGSGYSTSLGS